MAILRVAAATATVLLLGPLALAQPQPGEVGPWHVYREAQTGKITRWEQPSQKAPETPTEAAARDMRVIRLKDDVSTSSMALRRFRETNPGFMLEREQRRAYLAAISAKQAAVRALEDELIRDARRELNWYESDFQRMHDEAVASGDEPPEIVDDETGPE